MRLPFRIRIIATMVGLGSGWGGGIRSHRTPPPATGMQFLYLFVSLVGQKNELGEVGNEKPSFAVVLNRVPYTCAKKNY